MNYGLSVAHVRLQGREVLPLEPIQEVRAARPPGAFVRDGTCWF